MFTEDAAEALVENAVEPPKTLLVAGYFDGAEADGAEGADADEDLRQAKRAEDERSRSEVSELV